MPLFQGRLYWRGDDGYEQERVGPVFNGRKPDRYPAAILKAECEEDVVVGVRLALERGLKVSVRSGGHSWAAWSIRNDSLLIDLAGLREISLDINTGIVRVSPAVTGEELNGMLAEYGLMFNGGHCPSVGLGGFLLQGGMGWNCRGWGWACERIEAIDVVTADGELVRADATQNADLLWAARGSGPGFFVWKDEADDASCRAWLAEQMCRIEPVSEGLFLADSDFTKRSARFLSDAHWQRLEQLRAHYDPNGLFHSYLAEPGMPLNVNFWVEGE